MSSRRLNQWAARRHLAAAAVLAAAILPHPAWAGRASRSFLPNVGFEQAVDGDSTRVQGWNTYGKGYTIDSTVARTGRRSIRCENTSRDEMSGASFSIDLNQTRPLPVEVTGWSKADKVGGVPDGSYAILFDIQYADGTVHWEHTAPFSIGTHNWERKRLVIAAPKPIRHLSVYAIFRHHAGIVWFDDFEGRELQDPFDSQAVEVLQLHDGVSRAWAVRDVAEDSAPVAMNDGVALDLRLGDVREEQDGQVVRATLQNLRDQPRAVTLYYAERLDRSGGKPMTWWDDIHRSRTISGRGEGTNLVNTSAGANGWMSHYPWGCVTNGDRGRALGVPPDVSPRISRIGYHPGADLFYVAFDLALPAASAAATRAPATVAVARYDVDSAWGFRSAAGTFYRLFPGVFERHARAEGIWIPFTDPSTIPNVEDFGIAWHEGDNSIAKDDAVGIQSFRYKEPRSYVQSLPRNVPRTYEAAMEVIAQDLKGDDEKKRHWAEAVMTSNAKHRDGRNVVTFQVAPWSDGAVWVLNTSPHLPRVGEQWSKFTLNFSEEEQSHYAPGFKLWGGTLDGEFLDSMEAEADHLDFRPESLAHASMPLTFTIDTREETMPIWFSEFEYVAWLGDWLRQRGKLLFANTTLTRFHLFAYKLDLMGIESVWGTSQEFRPDPDEILSFRRTMCYHKPYLLLQNNDYDKFGHDAVERYFRRCMFYAIYPSMFSVNAADKPYWENPTWYERDRPLFKKYIPVIQQLSAAGWEPVPHVRSDNPAVWIERYGTQFLTLLNSSDNLVTATIRIDATALLSGGGDVTVTDLLTDEMLGDDATVTLTIPAGDTRVLRLSR